MLLYTILYIPRLDLQLHKPQKEQNLLEPWNLLLCKQNSWGWLIYMYHIFLTKGMILYT